MKHHSSRAIWLRRIRLAIVLLVAGTATTVAVAWGCAVWSPVRTTFNPMPNHAGIADSVDPDGHVGLHYRETGTGWTYPCLIGSRISTNDVWWSGPYGGVDHRLVGWPLPALRSRVEVLDSQRSSRTFEGGPETEATPQRRRWDLPLDEIVYRGIATKDLPTWLHAYPERRLPLVPMVFGFAVNTIVYATTIALVVITFQAGWRRQHPASELADGPLANSIPSDR